jgi:hypothetical protein
VAQIHDRYIMMMMMIMMMKIHLLEAGLFNADGQQA